jgi:glucosylceramidase
MNNLSKLASVAIGFLLFALEPKAQIKVYTTALNTNNRITLTDTLYFKPNEQPLEKQACVFIDVSKIFQTIEGIGGAITDASAEVF